MTPLVAYLLLFVAVGAGFIFVHLVIGKLIRPSKPGAEKQTIYECGEPTIGSAWIQFDLRFYVVALLFVIFDVEVAFFFPWAEVFGKSNTVVAEQAMPADFASMKAYSARAVELAPEAPDSHGGALYRALVALTPDDYGRVKTLALAPPREDLRKTQAASRKALDALPNTPANAAERRALGVLLALDSEQQLAKLRDRGVAAVFPDSVDGTSRELFRMVASMNAEEYEAFRKLGAGEGDLLELKEGARNALADRPDPVERKARLTVLAMNSDEQLKALRTRGVPLTELQFRTNRELASGLSWLALLEMAAFFGVLLVGFAYLWKRGDLAWVRSLQAERQVAQQRPAPAPQPQPKPAETALVAAGDVAAHH
jgi:NADH:ubiquinone oxidoreductase subunit 3 (subunit A)